MRSFIVLSDTFIPYFLVLSDTYIPLALNQIIAVVPCETRHKRGPTIDTAPLRACLSRRRAYAVGHDRGIGGARGGGGA